MLQQDKLQGRADQRPTTEESSSEDDDDEQEPQKAAPAVPPSPDASMPPVHPEHPPAPQNPNHGRKRPPVAVYVAPSVYLRRDALTQAENIFPEEGSRVILGSMTKEHEDPFGRWLCEELERQNPEDVAMIVTAEQETQTSPDDVVDAKERSELKTLLAQHHQKMLRGLPNRPLSSR